MATLPHARDLLEAFLDNGVVCAVLLVLFLSMEEGICLPVEVWQES